MSRPSRVTSPARPLPPSLPAAYPAGSAQALGDAEAAIKHGPVSWHKGHYRKAMAQLETLNYEEAVRSFAAAAERAPDETIRQDALNFLRKVRLPKPSSCASNYSY